MPSPWNETYLHQERKADIELVNECLNRKANKDSVATALQQKANKDDVEAQMQEMRSQVSLFYFSCLYPAFCSHTPKQLARFHSWGRDFEQQVTGARQQQQQLLELLDERQRSLDATAEALALSLRQGMLLACLCACVHVCVWST